MTEIVDTIADLTQRLAASERDYRCAKRFTGSQVAEGVCDHDTACNIWGNDGQGNVDGNPVSIPCSCGAHWNWAKRQEARAEQADRQLAELRAQNDAEIAAAYAAGLSEQKRLEYNKLNPAKGGTLGPVAPPDVSSIALKAKTALAARDAEQVKNGMSAMLSLILDAAKITGEHPTFTAASLVAEIERKAKLGELRAIRYVSARSETPGDVVKECDQRIAVLEKPAK